MSFGNNSSELKFRRLTNCDELKDFYCDIEEMNSFIHDKLKDSISAGYCKAYSVLLNGQVVAFYALNFDSLTLDSDDKEELKQFCLVGVKDEYSDLFWNKKHYPAIEISYIAVRKGLSGNGIGRSILAEIYQNATEQDLAGCQFITVEAYKRPKSFPGEPYSAVPFYSKFGFWSLEEPNPAKETVRMCLPLPVVQITPQESASD